MNECEKIKKLMQIWESERSDRHDDLSRERIDVAAEHARTCPACSVYAPLLSLIVRDSDRPDPVPPTGDEPLADVVARRVMERIRNIAPQRDAAPWKYPAFGLAALCVVLIGFIVLTRPGTPSRSDEITVRFDITVPEASNVALAGDFNDWEPVPLARTVSREHGNGVWEIEIRLKKGNMYKYNFIIDGEEWIIDPNSSVLVDDGFGGQNSIIQI